MASVMDTRPPSSAMPWPRVRRARARTLARTRNGLIYDDELNQAVMPRIASAGAHLYGRRSYELFRGVFTGPAAPPHAPLMTNTPKFLVSTTVASLTGGRRR